MRLSQHRSGILSHLSFRPLCVCVDSPACTYACPIFLTNNMPNTELWTFCNFCILNVVHFTHTSLQALDTYYQTRSPLWSVYSLYHATNFFSVYVCGYACVRVYFYKAATRGCENSSRIRYGNIHLLKIYAPKCRIIWHLSFSVENTSQKRKMALNFDSIIITSRKIFIEKVNVVHS